MNCTGPFGKAMQALSHIGCRRLSVQSQTENKLLKFLVDKIKTTGPITVAQYMQLAAGGSSGYYSQSRELFGQEGDFVTSPEVSQLFGELVGLWFASLFTDIGRRDQPWQLVEFGPGSGKLMYDILRTFSKLKLNDPGKLSVHLVETSKHLTSRQFDLLCQGVSRGTKGGVGVDSDLSHGHSSIFGTKVYWHEDLRDVPEAFSFFVANEFFDALPVHVFQRTDAGWREVLVDIDDQQQKDRKEPRLRFVLAVRETLTQRAYLPRDVNRLQLKRFEVCPLGVHIIKSIAERIIADGGAALIIDYGHCGEKGDTLRAFAQHRLVDDLLACPGETDITADVNFRYFSDQVHDKVCAFGPIVQAAFLRNLGIEIRYNQLLAAAKTQQEKQYLQSSYEYLTSDEKMGVRFKVFAMLPAVLSEFFKIKPLAGFS